MQNQTHLPRSVWKGKVKRCVFALLSVTVISGWHIQFSSDIALKQFTWLSLVKKLEKTHVSFEIFQTIIDNQTCEVCVDVQNTYG